MKINKRDYQTIATIVAQKAELMHKRGALWMQGRKMLTCVQVGKMANELLKLSTSANQKFQFSWEKKPLKKVNLSVQKKSTGKNRK